MVRSKKIGSIILRSIIVRGSLVRAAIVLVRVAVVLVQVATVLVRVATALFGVGTVLVGVATLIAVAVLACLMTLLPLKTQFFFIFVVVFFQHCQVILSSVFLLS